MSSKKQKTKKRQKSSPVPINFEDFTRRLDQADMREGEKRSQSEEFSFDLAHEKPHGTPDGSPTKARRSDTHPVNFISYEEYIARSPHLFPKSSTKKLFSGGRRRSRKSRKSHKKRKSHYKKTKRSRR